ncbi:hypothetical protein PHLH8_32680 [Pseudomonas sp. Pc102]|uniref:c-type cytochrome n=1 Tax=Pseudomonas sp. Pc102 TaxID=2678261 RepID=UPI001BCEB2B4|nr:c-type cytochrome [Pseudomonas sp. Pc102]BBP83626.1 hypothetical protein PHLH8_32680 [Pseudomonas sp. Pc102]
MPHNNKKPSILAVLPLLFLLPVLPALADCGQAKVEQGASAFAAECSVCHAARKDAAPGMGPNLAGVIGRNAGSQPGFAYSQAMKARGRAWEQDGLQAFIAQPQAEVPGTYMPYAGMADADQRQAIACFLAQQR